MTQDPSLPDGCRMDDPRAPWNQPDLEEIAERIISDFVPCEACSNSNQDFVMVDFDGDDYHVRCTREGCPSLDSDEPTCRGPISRYL